MKCPKCSTLLNEVTKAGVLIDVCDRPAREPAWRDDDDDDPRAPRRRRWSDMFDIFD